MLMRVCTIYDRWGQKCAGPETSTFSTRQIDKPASNCRKAVSPAVDGGSGNPRGRIQRYRDDTRQRLQRIYKTAVLRDRRSTLTARRRPQAGGCNLLIQFVFDLPAVAVARGGPAWYGGSGLIAGGASHASRHHEGR